MTNRRLALQRLKKNITEGSYTRRVLKKLGEKTVDVLVNNLANDETFDLKSFFKTQKNIHDTNNLEQTIHKLAETRAGGSIKGESIDGFSAFMVSKVLGKLNYEQKQRLLSKPTNEIIAISYKLASRSEF